MITAKLRSPLLPAAVAAGSSRRRRSRVGGAGAARKSGAARASASSRLGPAMVSSCARGRSTRPDPPVSSHQDHAWPGARTRRGPARAHRTGDAGPAALGSGRGDPELGPRAGRVLPRRRVGAAGDHRRPLDGARPGARRHPLLPVRRARRPRSPTSCALSRAMTYKNSLAGLDLGGGKAVIIGDPRTDKTEALLRAYGRFVEALGGRYLTACDVGTYNADLDVVARETRFAHGRSEAYGGCGDSSVLTAYGVFQGMRAAAQHTLGLPDRCPAGRSPSPAWARSAPGWSGTWSTTAPTSSSPTSTPPPSTGCRPGYPQVKAVADTATLVATAARRLRALRARRRARRARPWPCCPRSIVCGGANNQLATPGGRRAAASSRGHPLRARLPGERRRRHPGRGRAARLLVRAGPVEGQRHLRRRAAGVRGRRRRGRLPGGRRRPAGRGADAARWAGCRPSGCPR